MSANLSALPPPTRRAGAEPPARQVRHVNATLIIEPSGFRQVLLGRETFIPVMHKKGMIVFGWLVFALAGFFLGFLAGVIRYLGSRSGW